MIKGAIFDMDGLLVDSEYLTFKIIDKKFKEDGLDMSLEFYSSTVGRNHQSGRQVYLDKYGEDFDYEGLSSYVSKELLNRYNKGEIELKPGVIELLEYLKAHNVKTIVATSTKRSTATACLTGAKIIQYFDDMICGDEVTLGKPNPEVFIKAAKKIGVSFQDAIIFEDSEAGIRAAYAAKIPVICVPDLKQPCDEVRNMTYKVIDTLDQSIELLK